MGLLDRLMNLTVEQVLFRGPSVPLQDAPIFQK
jgi:hypothetical protein